ncbi:MAG: hypothetical protein KAG14_03155, partial [Mycoplasmataceae bacterium]|nr:hypothetical protein [Mycoplasmataceae bacterium]
KYDELLSHKYIGKSPSMADATVPNPNIKDNTVDLVVTSPPYLGIVDYTMTNWLKLWLLGYNKNTLKKDIVLSDSLKFDEYIVFITNVLNSMYSKIKIGGYVCLIVGDVHKTKLIEEVWKTIQDDVDYEFVEIFYDLGYSQNKKVLNSMNKRKGKATMIEKVLVLRKV